MKKRERVYFRPLRKTYRPWKPPLDPEKVEEITPTPDPPEEKWTADEWERIWRSTSG